MLKNSSVGVFFKNKFLKRIHEKDLLRERVFKKNFHAREFLKEN